MPSANGPNGTSGRMSPAKYVRTLWNGPPAHARTTTTTDHLEHLAATETSGPGLLGRSQVGYGGVHSGTASWLPSALWTVVWRIGGQSGMRPPRRARHACGGSCSPPDHGPEFCEWGVGGLVRIFTRLGRGSTPHGELSELERSLRTGVDSVTIDRASERSPEVLDRLIERIDETLAHDGLALQPADQIVDPGDRALVDVDGKVLAALPDDELLASASPIVLDTLEGLIGAYQGVLAALHQLRTMTVRAERAEREALEDHLTSLPNRRAWMQALDSEQARCDRSEGSVAIAVVDLDGLKRVNDEQGHLAGDLLVRQAATILRGAFRQSDVVARIGGDEFAVLVVDYNDQRPEVLATRVQAELARAGVGASIGAAVHEQPERLVDVFHRADEAMYLMKDGAPSAPSSTDMGPKRLRRIPPPNMTTSP